MTFEDYIRAIANAQRETAESAAALERAEAVHAANLSRENACRDDLNAFIVREIERAGADNVIPMRDRHGLAVVD